jgi:hypothetical protein
MTPAGINVEVILYAALGVAALVMIAVSVFLFKGDSSRNQILIAVGCGCLFVGLAGGMLTMFLLQGAMPQAKAGAPNEASPPAGGGRRALATPVTPGGMAGGMPGGMPAGMAGGRFQPAKGQLANLIDKLSLLTGKPLTLELSEEQKQQLRQQVKGLQDIDELTDDSAQRKLEAIQDALAEKRELLEAVGYRWSTPGDSPQGPMGAGPGLGGMGGFGGGPGGPGGPGMGRGRGGSPLAESVPNPFAEGKNRKSLEALQDRLSPAKSKATQ